MRETEAEHHQQPPATGDGDSIISLLKSCIKFAGVYGHKMAKDSNTEAALANNTEPEEPTKSASMF